VVSFRQEFGLGITKEGKESSSESRVSRFPWGSSMGWWDRGTSQSGPLKMCESLMCWTVVLPIGWGLVEAQEVLIIDFFNEGRLWADLIWRVGPQLFVTHSLCWVFSGVEGSEG